MIDPKWVKALTGDELGLKELYSTFRTPFLSFLRKTGINEDEALSIFHDTLITLRKKAIQGKLSEVKHQFKTYLFAIGKYKAYDLIQKEGKRGWMSISEFPDIEDREDAEDKEDLDENLNLIQKGIRQLGNSCQRMLTLFYIQGLKIKEIQEKEGYENENTVRAQKSRCLKSLKIWLEKQKTNE
ncbi:hypothetical protein Aoki45_37900 [Algoriphagus sp. oki45]|uniref:RNA polymerase sigma factor n=1 Tax=Algoriphagus sp. oki45 TaxID=3067294 RepID=UPI0027EFB8B3|nr:hypothetical protein Aoki45_37900 [Algoriphagus sp. oki45]